ncbi:MAG: 30S ribosomal protein S6 [Phycisphaerales bacterium]
MSSTSKGRRYNYEVMFLLSGAQSAQLGETVKHIEDLFKRAHVEVIAMKRWDERRLAYEIDKNKRGTYILAYFAADPANLAGFERDCNLSEKILRVLITRVDHMTVEEMQASDGRQDLATEAQLRGNAEPVSA